MTDFRYLLRVRYGECDAQGIVFNARWADYVDVAVCEYTRVLFGAIDVAITGFDWRLVKQTTEWRGPGRFDDILDVRLRTLRVGTTSFALLAELHRFNGELLVTCETIYVMVDARGQKLAIPPHTRAALERGAPDVVVDHAAALQR